MKYSSDFLNKNIKVPIYFYKINAQKYYLIVRKRFNSQIKNGSMK